MHGEHGSLSIWFFIGILLTAYGALILGAGLYEFVSPPEHPAVLANLHTGVWWGSFLLAVGLFYFVRFYPQKN